ETKQFVMSYQSLKPIKGTWSVIYRSSSGDEVFVEAKTTADLGTGYRVTGSGRDEQAFRVRVIDADHVELMLGHDALSRVRLRRAARPGGARARPGVVTADDLAKEFDAAPATADAKYKGKAVTVEGQVESVSVTPGGEYEVHFPMREGPDGKPLVWIGVSAR